jgi:hypothetical protein
VFLHTDLGVRHLQHDALWNGSEVVHQLVQRFVSWNCTHRECDDTRADRSNLPRCWLRPAGHVHAPRAGEGADAMKSSDSIVDEVRAAREALAKESDDNLEKIVKPRGLANLRVVAKS